MGNGDAHPGQLFLELTAGHGAVFVPPEVGNDAPAHTSTERLRSHEHPALHHEVSEADAAQKRGFAPPVGPRHHDERLTISAQVVAHSTPVCTEAEARVVETSGPEPCTVDRHWHGSANRLAPLSPRRTED